MKNKMKLISIGIFAIWVSILISSAFAKAAFEKPAIHEGDYWNHDVSIDYGMGPYQGTSYNEMIGETTITIEGESYDVWESIMHMVITGEDATSMYEATYYINQSDEAMVKSVISINSPHPDGTSISQSETIYKPIQPDMEYPTDVGDTWEIHRNNTVTDDTGTHIVSEDTYYECTGKEDVTTDAGTFSCYIIKSWDNTSDTGNYTALYYSNEAGGNPVKMIMYTNSVPTTALMLTSYKYTKDNGDEGGNDDGEGGGGIPGFELLSIIITLVIVIILLRKRKN